MAILGAPSAHRRSGGGVCVFDQFARGPGISEARVDGDVGIYSQQSAKREELIGANIVRLHGVPDGIENGWPLVDVTYGVAPLIRGDEVAAREAKHAEAQLLEGGDDFWTEAFDVVRGHQRNCANVEGARAGACDLESGVIGICCGGISQRELAVRGAEVADGDGLAVRGLFAPDERDLYDGAGRTRQNNASGVGLAIAHRDSGLTEAMRLFRIELDQR